MSDEVKSTNTNTLPPVVEFRNVSKVWNPGTPGECKALENLNFCIDDIPGKGEFITVLGPSGCGKSTMLNLLAGFREVFPPTTGEIFSRGKPVERPGIDRGMVFQKYSSFPHLTVLQNVAFGMRLNKEQMGFSESDIIEQSREWINKVGLAAHEAKYPHQLSGGQQQRVALARTLVLKPRIILMDEPFSALDEPTRLEMQRLVVDLWEKVKATVMMITHSIIEAVFMGDRVWLFSHAPGKIEKVFNDIPKADTGLHPLVMQGRKEFQEAVEQVAASFREIEKTKPVKK
ncbi:MAG: ABC transporter ATP-binding protein [Acidobacteria bacterium]|nr:ABC transporter ATP-binding protein [Acidobacteriota bacterium]